ncbi:UNVERIFIED_CONTAM: hypothetical protein Slati_2661200 [Sesamum latifolium]|uniref:Uncharacterized protein n=1 Tax=Sesamum latifolium TaxID=2727402 RepID=A0AAW2VU50_9LAMI
MASSSNAVSDTSTIGGGSSNEMADSGSGSSRDGDDLDSVERQQLVVLEQICVNCT